MRIHIHTRPVRTHVHGRPHACTCTCNPHTNWMVSARTLQDSSLRAMKMERRKSACKVCGQAVQRSAKQCCTVQCSVTQEVQSSTVKAALAMQEVGLQGRWAQAVRAGSDWKLQQRVRSSGAMKAGLCACTDNCVGLQGNACVYGEGVRVASTRAAASHARQGCTACHLAHRKKQPCPHLPQELVQGGRAVQCLEHRHAHTLAGVCHRCSH